MTRRIIPGGRGVLLVSSDFIAPLTALTDESRPMEQRCGKQHSKANAAQPCGAGIPHVIASGAEDMKQNSVKGSWKIASSGQIQAHFSETSRAGRASCEPIATGPRKTKKARRAVWPSGAVQQHK
jgi:hypothetical protein